MIKKQKFNAQDKTDQELLNILHRQHEMMLDAIIAAKNELEKRNIDISFFKIRDQRESDTEKMSIGAIIIHVILLGFYAFIGIWGIIFVYDSYINSNYVLIFLGMVPTLLGFLSILSLLDFGKIGDYLFEFTGRIFGFIIILILGVSFLGMLFMAFVYTPFFEENNFDLDLGILIIKDGFIRFLFVVFDILLVFYVVKYLIRHFKSK